MNLRYTDYGRPFDFLKAKNTYHQLGVNEIDTATLYQPSEKGVDISFANEEELNIKDVSTGHPEVVLLNEVLESTEEIGKEKANYCPKEASQVALKNKFSKVRPLVNSNRLKVRKWPPEWWTNMWSNFWNWVLKWLLILLAVCVVLALLIWGIYALISVIANPTVAGIVVFCIIMLFYMLIEFS